MTMDVGHHNCRDYHIPPDAAYHVLEQRLAQTHLTDEYTTEIKASSLPSSLPFLNLPLEIRQQIYTYLLPSVSLYRIGLLGVALPSRASAAPSNSRTDQPTPVWTRGQASLLCICRQVHDECATLLYGNSTFKVFVTYDSINFHLRWLLSNGLTPSRRPKFLKLVPPRYLGRVKRLDVYVDHVDSYTGMIKFNVGGKGLTHGLIGQVQKLVDALRAADGCASGCNVINLRITLLDGKEHLDSEKGNSRTARERESNLGDNEEVQTVLAPFAELHGIPQVKVTGAVTKDYAAYLEEAMTSSGR